MGVRGVNSGIAGMEGKDEGSNKNRKTSCVPEPSIDGKQQIMLCSANTRVTILTLDGDEGGLCIVTVHESKEEGERSKMKHKLRRVDDVLLKKKIHTGSGIWRNESEELRSKVLTANMNGQKEEKYTRAHKNRHACAHIDKHRNSSQSTHTGI
ncbi:hypothetical protein Pmani_007739 [Petrolisthes manimaculis]|uniref:Uncharacterized protein n=1 Tax=Petrolisthes manimaculis TaxID=1843537 RepID=A0AAE1Q859_9EUCA|nr:hypothetical protein Pmani_007739 [Petrolisthes manimaculis]